MSSFINFKNYGENPQPEGSGGKPPGNLPLARQTSVYSLTFDELQNTFGGLGKDFGSINMEDLLKSIWTAEENQTSVSSFEGGSGSAPSGNLQRQGSLTLPRTLSQKTVDEVWRDLFKEGTTGDAKDGSSARSGGSNLVPRQPTLGEITLEEFLVRAGVVREDIQQTAKPNAGGFYGGSVQPSNSSSGLSIGFQQPVHNLGALGNRFLENSTAAPNQNNLMLNMAGGRSPHQQQQHQQGQSQEQPLFPKQSTLAFSSGMQLGSNGQLSSPGAKCSVLGMSNSSLSTTLAQGGVTQNGATGLATLHNTPTSLAGGSPGNHLPCDVISKSNLDTSSLSGSPYSFGEGGRGRRSCASLEKVVERRRRRMIKNRESAARSRARKQAYTLQLEAEVAKLKEINKELRQKQSELIETQKNQKLETVKTPWGGKKRCLRRTLTGPW